MKRLVIDASVALKWYLPDEESGQKALDILDAHIADRVALHAPALLEFEMANALAMARRRARASAEDALKAMDGFAGLGMEFHSVSRIFRKVLDYSDKHGISAYDAAYVALADDLGVNVVTADKRLFNSTRKLRFVKLVEDFRV